MMRRDPDDEIEFATIMWFDDLDAVQAFVGEDCEFSHASAAPRAILSHFDEREIHYHLFDRREQGLAG
jgi:hypothetical protein